MSGNINIGVSNDDPSYRYQMPKLMTKIEGRGNGIKTVIVNMSDIASALRTDPAFPTKFFGVELGAQSKYDKATDKAVVNGSHNPKDLATLLNKFIELFILCPNCNLPEITMTVKKGAIKMDCASCGHYDNCTSSHKLTAYILKNPPTVTKTVQRAKEASKTKEVDEALKKLKSEQNAASAAAAANAAPAANKKVKVTKKAPSGDDVVWFTDTSAEAQALRRQEEIDSLGIQGDITEHVDAIMNATANGNSLGNDESASSSLRSFVDEQKHSSLEIISEVKRLQMVHNLSNRDKYVMAFEVLCDSKDASTFLNTMKSNLDVFKSLALEEPGRFMDALEKFAIAHPKSVQAKISLILQEMFDEGVVGEAVIVEWFDTPYSSEYIELRKKAGPFMEWLKNAEEEW